MDAVTNHNIVTGKCFGQDENEYVWLINSKGTSDVHAENTYSHFKATLPRILYHHETCDLMLNSAFSNWRIGANQLEKDYYLPFTIWSFDVFVSDTKMVEVKDTYGDEETEFKYRLPAFTDLDNTSRKYTSRILLPRGTVFQNQYDSLNLVSQGIKGQLSDDIIKNKLFHNVLTRFPIIEDDDCQPYPWWTAPRKQGEPYLFAAHWPTEVFTREFCDGLRGEIGRVLWQPAGKYGMLGMFTYGYMTSSCWQVGPECEEWMMNNNRSENCVIKTRCIMVGLHFINVPEDQSWEAFTRSMPSFRYVFQAQGAVDPIYPDILSGQELNFLSYDIVKLARLLGFPQTHILPFNILNGFLNSFNIPAENGMSGSHKYFFFSEPRWDAFLDHLCLWRAPRKQPDSRPEVRIPGMHALAIYDCTLLTFGFPCTQWYLANDTSPLSTTRVLDTTTMLNFLFGEVGVTSANPPEWFHFKTIQPLISLTQFPYGQYSSTLTQTCYVHEGGPWNLEIFNPLFTSNDMTSNNSVFLVPFLTPDFYLDDEVLLIRIRSPIYTLTYMDENFVDFISVIPIYNVSSDSSFVVQNVYLEPYTVDVLKAIPCHSKYYYNMFTSNKDLNGSPENGYDGDRPNPNCHDKDNEWSLRKTGPIVWYPLPVDVFGVFSEDEVSESVKYPGYVYRPFNITYPGGNIYVNQIGNYQPFKWLNEFQERTPVKLYADGAELNELEIEIVNRFGQRPAVTVFGCKIPETNINVTLQYNDTTYKRRCFSSFAGTRIPFTSR